jgi:hypothetical protein
MREQHKPFIMYREGRGSFKIVPRGAAGWRAMILWFLVVVPITGLFILFALGEPSGTRLYVGLAAFTLAMAAWGIGGMIWMRRRAEVVDLQELLELKRERDRESRRR